MGHSRAPLGDQEPHAPRSGVIWPRGKHSPFPNSEQSPGVSSSLYGCVNGDPGLQEPAAAGAVSLTGNTGPRSPGEPPGLFMGLRRKWRPLPPPGSPLTGPKIPRAACDAPRGANTPSSAELHFANTQPCPVNPAPLPVSFPVPPVPKADTILEEIPDTYVSHPGMGKGEGAGQSWERKLLRQREGLDTRHPPGGVNPAPLGHCPLSPRSHFNRLSPQWPPSEHVLLPVCVNAG